MYRNVNNLKLSSFYEGNTPVMKVLLLYLEALLPVEESLLCLSLSDIRNSIKTQRC